jgi:hypothetical protein
MPAVQFGVLLSILLYGEGLRQSGASLNHVQHRGTPNSRVLCARFARMISPVMFSTYVNLAFDNPHNHKWLEGTISTLTQFQKWMNAGNREAVLAWMRELAEFQPKHFQSHFAEASVFLDECLAKREFLAACLAKETEIQGALEALSHSSASAKFQAA